MKFFLLVMGGMENQRLSSDSEVVNVAEIWQDVCDKIYFCILRRFESVWNILEYARDPSLFYKGRYYYSLSKQGDLVIYDMDDEDEQPTTTALDQPVSSEIASLLSDARVS
uniref:Uncharacterized protein n=1 Tax=Solanum lycopersicum TaxID=4081 RepID=K4B7X2_SOLLC